MKYLLVVFFGLIISLAVAVATYFITSNFYVGQITDLSLRLEEYENPVKEIDSKFTDEQILEFAYSNDYNPPESFFIPEVDRNPDSDKYRNIEYYWEEVQEYDFTRFSCANDLQEAVSRIEKMIQIGYGSSDYPVTEHIAEEFFENDMFFQFEVVRDQNPSPNINLHRVFKCNYVSQIDYYLTRDTFAYVNNGVQHIAEFANEDMTEERAQNAMDFLFYVVGRGKIVDHSIVKDRQYVSNIFYVVKINGGDWGTCDSINLKKVKFTMNIYTGSVTMYLDHDQQSKTITGACIPNPYSSSDEYFQ